MEINEQTVEIIVKSAERKGYKVEIDDDHYGSKELIIGSLDYKFHMEIDEHQQFVTFSNDDTQVSLWFKADTPGDITHFIEDWEYHIKNIEQVVEKEEELSRIINSMFDFKRGKIYTEDIINFLYLNALYQRYHLRDCHIEVLSKKERTKHYNELDRFISVDEAAKMWDMTPQHIRRLCEARKIISKKIGSCWIIDIYQPNPATYKKND